MLVIVLTALTYTVLEEKQKTSLVFFSSPRAYEHCNAEGSL